jgi:hypothetical protein
MTKGNTVRSRDIWATAFLLGLAICALPTTRAKADTVLYDSSGFLQGTQSFAQTFNLSAPGTLTVTLSNVAWPQQLANLNFLLSSANGIIGSEMSAGTFSFDIAAGGNVFAQWFGTAQGPLNTGVYSLKIDFQPLGGGGTPVPLPTSGLLLLSGLALLLWKRRTRTGAARGSRQLV